MDVQKQDGVTIEKVVGARIPALQEVPVQLLQRGVIAAQDWAELSDEQRSMILKSYGINPEQYIAQFESAQKSVGALAETKPATPEVAPVQAPVVESVPAQSPVVQPKIEMTPQHSEVRAQFDQIKKEVEVSEEKVSIPKEGLSLENKPALTYDEQQRVAAETGMAFNQPPQTPKLFGYQASDQTAANATAISDSNPVSDGKTWVATLIKKILLSFK